MGNARLKFSVTSILRQTGDGTDNATVFREKVAQTIPQTISSKWKGEQRLFALLKRLPDDVVVYYEPIIDNRLPDFVVILPEIGVLLIEVKDWKLSTIMPEARRSRIAKQDSGGVFH